MALIGIARIRNAMQSCETMHNSLGLNYKFAARAQIFREFSGAENWPESASAKGLHNGEGWCPPPRTYPHRAPPGPGGRTESAMQAKAGMRLRLKSDFHSLLCTLYE